MVTIKSFKKASKIEEAPCEGFQEDYRFDIYTRKGFAYSFGAKANEQKMPPDKYHALKEISDSINKNKDKKVCFLLTTLNDEYTDEPICIVAVMETGDDEDLPPAQRASADGG